MAEPCLRHEVRGSHKRQRWSKLLPLTLTLSPRKSGERGFERNSRLALKNTINVPGIGLVRKARNVRRHLGV
jgi:hypothetical protein